MLPEANHTGKSVPAPPPVGWGRMYNPSPSIPSQLVIQKPSRPPPPIWLSSRKARSNRVKLDNQIGRSEEHTSELQSRGHLVCRLLLEKKKSKHRGRTRSHTALTLLITFFLFPLRRPPGSALFPYTTLFRSPVGWGRMYNPSPSIPSQLVIQKPSRPPPPIWLSSRKARSNRVKLDNQIG